MTNLSSLANLGVVVVGLAREGSAAARFFAKHGARVTVTDARPAEKLSRWIDALGGMNIRFELGAHPADLLDTGRTDVLVVSPGVPPEIPFLQQARQRKLLLTTESRILSQFSPAPVVGITGSSGKTTTTTLVGKMLASSGLTTHVGGNIGTPLINRLDTIHPTDRVVLELSSFQLAYFYASDANCPAMFKPLRADFSPAIGAILNITPNHLDRHKTMAAYTTAKRAIIHAMHPGDTAIFGWDDPIAHRIGMESSVPNVRWFSLNDAVENGAFLHNGHIILADGDSHQTICAVDDIKLRGRHNWANILAACAIAHSAGASPNAMRDVATTFTGVAHRLEIVAENQGVTFINDSIATSPERMMAALNAFSAPIILLAGGKDKDLPWNDAAKLMHRRAKHILLFGDAESLIEHALANNRSAQHSATVEACHTLAVAVSRAQALAQAGDVVLLSPGGTSYDAYTDFVERGEHFRQLVTEANR